jgi:cytochrome d ubiquinol oxidase subunit II
MVPCSNDPARSLTVFNSSSSQLTLTAMLVITLIGMPLVLAYTVYIHRVFRGKINVE